MHWAMPCTVTMPDYAMSDAEDDRPTLRAPEPVRPWAAVIGRGLTAAHEFASAPFGYDNPPGRMVSEFVGVPQAGRVMEDVGYGTTHITDDTAKGREWRMQAAEALPVLAPAARGVAKAAWEAAGKMPRVPHGQVQMFLAPGPREQNALMKAQELEAKGVEPEKIWAETGMLRWLDGTWKHEISDHEAAFKVMSHLKETRKRTADRIDALEHAAELRTYLDQDMSAQQANAVFKRVYGKEPSKLALHYAQSHTFDELVDKSKSAWNELNAPIDSVQLGKVFSHPELEKQVPAMAKTRFSTFEPQQGELGKFSPSGVGRLGEVGLSTALSPRRVAGKGTTLHELQHAHDYLMGYDYGSSPTLIKSLAADQGIKLSDEEAHALYERVSGEVLARLTAARAPLTAENRRQMFPMARTPYGVDVPAGEVRTMEDIYKRGVRPYNAPKE